MISFKRKLLAKLTDLRKDLSPIEIVLNKDLDNRFIFSNRSWEYYSSRDFLKNRKSVLLKIAGAKGVKFYSIDGHLNLTGDDFKIIATDNLKCFLITNTKGHSSIKISFLKKIPSEVKVISNFKQEIKGIFTIKQCLNADKNCKWLSRSEVFIYKFGTNISKDRKNLILKLAKLKGVKFYSEGKIRLADKKLKLFLSDGKRNFMMSSTSSPEFMKIKEIDALPNGLTKLGK